jgi:mono/diheme cytochrome c family protein
MQYPFWDLAAGQGILIIGIAIVHVFISHFAIGGGFFLVANERTARKNNDPDRLEFLQGLSRFFVLVTLVGGALTGVGIWFAIGLLNPAATEVLIRNFVWGWAIEWTFFAVEILAAILYCHGWKRMPPSSHMALGWIYLAFAWLSLFVINGILSFMLTPGRWIFTGSFWDGFFNPTFWPSLVLRSFISVMLAGLYALLAASRYRAGDLKARLVRNAAAWGLVGLLGSVPSFYWYWRDIPGVITTAALQSLPTPMRALQSAGWLTLALSVLLVLFGFIAPKLQHLSTALITILVGLAWFGSFEWFRESVRKPYVIVGYLYANSIPVAETERVRQSGYLPQIAFRSQDMGADLFRHACGNCHTFRGYKSLNPAFAGTDRPFIAAIIRSIHYLKGNMPPFLGTSAEADAIAAHIQSKVDRRPMTLIYKVQGAQLGKKVYEIRCGKCHSPGGQRDNSKSLQGLAREDYENILGGAALLGLGMPAFTADKADRAALIEYLTARSVQ